MIIKKRKINVDCVISSIDLNYGGPSRSVTHLIEEMLKEENIEISLKTISSESPIIRSFQSKKGEIHFYDNNNFSDSLYIFNVYKIPRNCL